MKKWELELKIEKLEKDNDVMESKLNYIYDFIVDKFEKTYLVEYEDGSKKIIKDFSKDIVLKKDKGLIEKEMSSTFTWWIPNKIIKITELKKGKTNE